MLRRRDLLALLIRCAQCKVELEAGAERCPQCLRKSTLVGEDGKAVGASYLGLGGEPPVAAPPAHVGIRAGILVLAYGIFGPLLGLIFARQPWLEAHALWVPACFAAMALGTFPLRMAFAPPDGGPMSAAQAARHYAFRMLAVLGLAAGLFVAQGLAAKIVSDPVVAIFLGLLLLLLPLLVVPAVVAARREKRPIRAVLGAGARGLAIAIAVVAVVAILVVLRTSSRPRPTTIFIPRDQLDMAPSGRPASIARPAR